MSNVSKLHEDHSVDGLLLNEKKNVTFFLLRDAEVVMNGSLNEFMCVWLFTVKNFIRYKACQLWHLTIDKTLVSDRKLKDCCDQWIFKGHCSHHSAIPALIC